MILRTRQGDVSVRSGQIGDSSVPIRAQSLYTYTGRYIDQETATGLAAWGAAIRLISTTLASMELEVYQGEGSAKRSVDTGPLAQLMEHPWSEGSQYDWLSDVAMSVEAFGNAFCQKLRDKRGQVVELVPLDPDRVRIRRDLDTQLKVFDVSDPNSRIGWRTFTTRDILHVRGFSVRGFLSGFTPVQTWRNTIANGLALEEFQGRHFRNNAAPGVVIEVAGKVDREAGRAMLESWQAEHGGLPNASKPALLWNGAKLNVVPLNLTDAQFIETQRYSVEEVARITGVPAVLLDVAPQKSLNSTEQDWLRFMRLCLYPRAKRILAALCCDPDLFANTDMYPELEYNAALAVDAATQAQVDKERVQSGILLVDEIRAGMGLGPLPPVPADWTLAPGMVPQITPVGGAPNPEMNGASVPLSELDAGENEGPEATISAEDEVRSLAVGGVQQRDVMVRAMLGALADGIRAALEPAAPPVVNVNVPEQPAPVVHVPAPIVNVAAADVTVNVPEQPAPIVNVAPAEVTVNVPEQSAPVVNVMVPEEPARKQTITVKRDPRTGLITSAEVTE